ncbi:MAG: hypothetical protein UY63_C0009G0013 [Parcubacteria group bacterium GW2011_GWA2_51_10]|nr:MAG: hypothetical protein UY63_C0009G0013 [Parcubacteria group bacterium GW2011_GWA2_51_10]
MTPYRIAQFEPQKDQKGFLARWWYKRRQRLEAKINKNVATSAKFLDRMRPGWQRWVITETLDPTSGFHDVLGQLCGAAERGKWLGALGREAWAGFSCVLPWRAKYYRAAWIREIESRPTRR